VIYYVSASVVAVLLPHVRMRQSAGENRRMFLKALSLVGALCGSAFIVMALVPSQVVRLFLGERYLELAPLLPLIAIHMLVVAFLSVLVTYSIALNRMSILRVCFLGIAVTIGCLAFFHASPEQVILSFLAGSVTTGLLLGIFSGSSPRALTGASRA
jgi:O-antigen/teichoic acid export membrane protein